jgi:predicted thioesterase
VKALLGDTIVGEGTHERAIIDVKKFKERVAGSPSADTSDVR